MNHHTTVQQNHVNNRTLEICQPLSPENENQPSPSEGTSLPNVWIYDGEALDRLPTLVNQCLTTQSQMAKDNNLGIFKEDFHPQALKTSIQYLLVGFTGFSGIG